MSTVSDIIALLDKIPLWKQLKEMPGKLERLEERVAELEDALDEQTVVSGDQCPKCKHRTFELTHSRPHPTFGKVGGLERTYRCSECDFEEKKFVQT